MARLPRLGLQGRIMLLVTVGLALMFTVGGLLGLTAIDEATQQVFEERLATAHATVAVFQRDVDRLASDVALVAELASTASAASERVLERIGDRGRYPFFHVVGVSALDDDGAVVGSAGHTPAELTAATLQPESRRGAMVAPALPTTADGVAFFDIVVPLGSASDGPIAMLVGHTVSTNQDSPFQPSGRFDPAALELGPAETEPYNLEVLAADGTTLLAVGDSGQAGTISHHLSELRDALASRESAALVDDRGASHHVMAAVPIPESSLFLVLEQPVDVALALPNRLREQLALLIGLGFTTALFVAWVTTRRVVKPTAELTAAASRMADGDLSEPIDVAAYDEVGTLATTLELMRRRLMDAQTQLVEVNRDLEQRIRERTARLGFVLRKTISAQEDERHALARELHDETAQTIAALSIALDRARQDAIDGDGGLERITEARLIAKRLLEEIRRLIMGLRPSVLDDLGLGPAIEWYAETVMAERQRPTLVTVEVPDERLPGHLEVALFRITQEALNNVAKHADATTTRVLIHRDTDVELIVEDDGVGFDVDAATHADSTSGGVGLAGMQERAALLGGTMDIASAVGQGSRLTVRVPLAEPGSAR